MSYVVDMFCRKTAEVREEAIKKKNKYRFTYEKMFALFWPEILAADKKPIPPDRLKLLEDISNDFEEKIVKLNSGREQPQMIIQTEINQIEKRFKE
jgi:hypothetical protein